FLRGYEGALAAVLVDELGGLGVGAVVDRDGEAVAGEVAGEIRAHDGQPDHSDVGGAHACPLTVSSDSLEPCCHCVRPVILAEPRRCDTATAHRIHAAGSLPRR